MKRFLVYAAFSPLLCADPLNCSIQPGGMPPGIEARCTDTTLSVRWNGERGEQLRAQFGIDHGQPMVRELAVRKKGGAWSTLGRDLVPEFTMISGRRRSGHGLPEEHRWDVFWDAPLLIPGAGDNPDLPRKPEEIRRATASFQSHACEVRPNGSRLEISFPGLSMGIFSGQLQYTVYQGSNLLRQEAIAQTQEPSVAYKYTGALRGFSTHDLERVWWRDPGGNIQKYEFGGTPNRDPAPLKARNRLAVAEGQGGSIVVFPAPHQFFFAREIEVNLGFVWYRKDTEGSFSMGVRFGDRNEGYNPVWERVFALYNAPPGSWQRMPVYFYLSPENGNATRQAVLAYTHGDHYKPLAGYQTMATHFHVAFTKELMDAGSLDVQPPWIPAMRDLGVNIAMIFDFHGDGHPQDTGAIRLNELENYYAACRRHSDREFLILPGEEANAYLGGHYNILFPKPVYWTHRRAEGSAFIEKHPKYGTVYHTASAADVFEMMQRENALVWQTHPRTKGSTFYPDRIREEDYFRSDYWLGAAFKSLPVDLSERRLCEKRCFGTLDDMNNWGRPKYMVGEVDTYKKFPDYDLYGDFNINYVKLDRLPAGDDWSSITRALRAGQFFVSTGEVLITQFQVHGTTGVSANVEWTFPLEFVEVVFGDGNQTDRKIVSATDTAPFGSRRFEIPVNLKGQKWVRLAAWDSAVNGAFTQPAPMLSRE